LAKSFNLLQRSDALAVGKICSVRALVTAVSLFRRETCLMRKTSTQRLNMTMMTREAETSARKECSSFCKSSFTKSPVASSLFSVSFISYLGRALAAGALIKD